MKPHVIIKFKPGVIHALVPDWVSVIERNAPAPTRIGHAADELFAKYNLSVWVTREYPAATDGYNRQERDAELDLVYRFILQNESAIPAQLLQELNARPDISYARAGIIGAANIPAAMTAVMPSDHAREAIFLKQAHLFSTGHPSIKVAVLDTGVDLDHPELESSLTDGYDFVDIINGSGQFIGDFLGYDAIAADEVGHGTHVAGIIAAKGLHMPKGVVPGCRIMPVRVLGAMQSGDKKVGAGLVDNINTAIKWSVDNGADVINMSLGVKHEQGGLPHEEVVRYALEKGVTIVAASGNDGTMDKYYPGALPGVIAVAAVDNNDQVAEFSTYGVHVSLAAPGTDIMSSFHPNTYAICSGTSQAAPFVTGAVALLKSYAKQQGKKLTDNHIKYLLKHSSDKSGRAFKNDKRGYGRINLVDALKLLQHMQSQLN